jgi:L-ascorbate metabolism protein UlaG (beta-lactamase superfamily)
MGPDDALRAVELLAPKIVIPIHYDTFDVIKQDPGVFAARVEAETSAKCVILAPGDSLQL